MDRNYRFEICANSVESCSAAQQGGADRVELCGSIPEGGTTPSYGEMLVARRLLTIRLHAIIRPRGGDFLYNAHEAATMIADIQAARQAGADGVVVGCLTAEGDIDLPLLDRLLDEAKGLSVTFHRAFDSCRNPFAALELLATRGVDRILTSGQQPTAPEGAPLLRQLVEAAGNRITVWAGWGVNETNIRSLAQTTGVTEFHFSAREPVASAMKVRNAAVKMGNKDVDEYMRMVTTAHRVRETIAQLS